MCNKVAKTGIDITKKFQHQIVLLREISRSMSNIPLQDEMQNNTRAENF